MLCTGSSQFTFRPVERTTQSKLYRFLIPRRSLNILQGRRLLFSYGGVCVCEFVCVLGFAFRGRSCMKNTANFNANYGETLLQDRRAKRTDEWRPKTEDFGSAAVGNFVCLALWMALLLLQIVGKIIVYALWLSHTHTHTHLDSFFGKCLFEWANWNKNWPNYIMSLSWRQFYNSANTRAQHLLAGCQQQRAEQSVCVCVI